jgi:hypothetical protein
MQLLPHSSQKVSCLWQQATQTANTPATKETGAGAMPMSHLCEVYPGPFVGPVHVGEPLVHRLPPLLEAV